MGTPEHRVKVRLKRWLHEEGWYMFWPVQTGYGAPMVDCLAWKYREQPLAIECKREGVSQPTPRQSAVMQAMRRHGVRTYVVTIEDDKLVWLEQAG